MRTYTIEQIARYLAGLTPASGEDTQGEWESAAANARAMLEDPQDGIAATTDREDFHQDAEHPNAFHRNTSLMLESARSRLFGIIDAIHNDDDRSDALHAVGLIESADASVRRNGGLPAPAPETDHTLEALEHRLAKARLDRIEERRAGREKARIARMAAGLPALSPLEEAGEMLRAMSHGTETGEVLP